MCVCIYINYKRTQKNLKYLNQFSNIDLVTLINKQITLIQFKYKLLKCCFI